MIEFVRLSTKEEYKTEFQDHICETDKESLKFSKKSLEYHDFVYNNREPVWKKPVLATKVDGVITTVLFYNFTRDKNLTIINIVTPIAHRRNGYAKVLLSEACRLSHEQGGKRLRMWCEPPAVPFYNKMNMVYWGCNERKEHYCNMPLLPSMDDYISTTFTFTQLVGDEKVQKMIDKRIKSEFSEKLIVEGNRNLYNEFRQFQEAPYVSPLDQFFS